MITRDVAAFAAHARRVLADLPALPRGVLLVSPAGFAGPDIALPLHGLY
jgi:hypothetical protein